MIHDAARCRYSPQAMPIEQATITHRKMEKTTATEAPHEDYVLAVDNVAEGDNKDDIGNMQGGHRCCGGCCDMRRATMIVNYISIGAFIVYWDLIHSTPSSGTIFRSFIYGSLLRKSSKN